MVTECEFSNIYNEYYPKIIQYLSRIAGPNDAEGLAQEVFDKINRNLGGFKEESKLSTRKLQTFLEYLWIMSRFGFTAPGQG